MLLRCKNCMEMNGGCERCQGGYVLPTNPTDVPAFLQRPPTGSGLLRPDKRARELADHYRGEWTELDNS